MDCALWLLYLPGYAVVNCGHLKVASMLCIVGKFFVSSPFRSFHISKNLVFVIDGR